MDNPKGGIMETLHFDFDCPKCHTTVHVPFFRDLEAKAVEDFDLLEVSAQARLSGLSLWLSSVSLFGLIKYWIKRNVSE